VAEEAQPAQRDLGGEVAREHAPLDEHGDARQTEAHGGDTAWRPGIGLVADQAVDRVALVQVVKEGRHLQAVQVSLSGQPIQVLDFVGARAFSHYAAVLTRTSCCCPSSARSMTPEGTGWPSRVTPATPRPLPAVFSTTTW